MFEHQPNLIISQEIERDQFKINCIKFSIKRTKENVHTLFILSSLAGW